MLTLTFNMIKGSWKQNIVWEIQGKKCQITWKNIIDSAAE